MIYPSKKKFAESGTDLTGLTKSPKGNGVPYGQIAALGAGIIDAVDQPDEANFRAPSVAGTAAKGALAGAAAGASFGPWGAVIGGAIGGTAGYFQGVSGQKKALNAKNQYLGKLQDNINKQSNAANNLFQQNITRFSSFAKKGGTIHIKPENKGKFTSYCGGEVTSTCIAKGKASSSSTIRKRATFAANARKWKHQSGGRLYPKYCSGGMVNGKKICGCGCGMDKGGKVTEPAESTGVVRKPLLKVIKGVDDLDVDSKTKQFLSDYVAPPSTQMHSWTLRQLGQFIQNGKPTIEQYDDVERAEYYPNRNTMVVGTKKPTNDYLAELSHSQQWKRNQKDYNRRYQLERKLPDNSNPGGRYSTPGTLEFEAHRIIEPSLRDEFFDTGVYRQIKRDEKKLKKFEEGGAVILGGERHSEGGNDVIDESGEKVAETETKELLLSKEQTVTVENFRQYYYKSRDTDLLRELGQYFSRVIKHETVDKSETFTI